MTKLTLKPCPFCGGKAIAENHPGWKIKCTECGVGTPDFYVTDVVAAHFWNDRHTTSDASPMHAYKITFHDGTIIMASSGEMLDEIVGKSPESVKTIEVSVSAPIEIKREITDEN